ncbi:hypothetical protein, partial [Xanthomonas citri]
AGKALQQTRRPHTLQAEQSTISGYDLPDTAANIWFKTSGTRSTAPSVTPVTFHHPVRLRKAVL